MNLSMSRRKALLSMLAAFSAAGGSSRLAARGTDRRTVVQEPLGDGLVGSISLDPADRMLEIALDAGLPTAKRFLVQDGVMNSLTSWNDEGDKKQFVFIAKWRPASESAVIFPVNPTEVVREGRKVPMLRVGAAIDEATAAESLNRVGVQSVRISLAAGLLPESNKHLSQDEALDLRRRCCSYRPCPPDVYGLFCTYGPGCGGDGCGECCV